MHFGKSVRTEVPFIMFFFSNDYLLGCLLEIVACCLFTIYALLSYQHSKWTRRGITFYNVHPIFGNFQDVFFGKKKIHEVIKNFYLEHKNKPLVGFFSFTQPQVMITDIELVRNVLVKDFSSFADRSFAPNESADPLEHYSIFASKGQQWKDLRAKLSPTFTSGKMKRVFELINSYGMALVGCLEKERDENGELEVREVCSRYTVDVIASVAFGIQGNALHDPKSIFLEMMIKSVTPSFKQTIALTLIGFFPSLADKLQIGVTDPKVANFFRKTVWDNVEYRKKNKITRNDFLDLMMQIRDKGYVKNDNPLEEGKILEESKKKQDLDGDKFVAQCYIFLTDGFETSSETMIYTLYELALNQEIQTKLYEEITSVLSKHSGKVTYDSVQEMEYLHMAVQETLRKYPSLHFLDRQVTRPYSFPGTDIEMARGESVMIPVIGLHYNPDWYPEPERYDPERFSEEQKRTRPPCSFLGFGDGPRMCIGMRLGYIQAKVGLVHTLLHYEVSISPATPIPIPSANCPPFNIPACGVPLRMKKRSC